MRQHHLEKSPKIPFPDEGGTVIERVIKTDTKKVVAEAKDIPPTTGPELDLDSVRRTEEDINERGSQHRWKTH